MEEIKKGIKSQLKGNILISVDPGSSKPSTCAVFVDNDYEFSFRVNRLDENYYSFLEELSKLTTGILAIETQWYQRNVNTLILLVTARVEMETIFRLNGWEIYRVHPQRWQTYIIKNMGKMRRISRKKKSIEYVNKHIGVTKDDNVADAINIGIYTLYSFSKEKS